MSLAREIQQQTARRRTFAIISHPDAGKTTLTEKLLLYGGAIQMAGAVKSRKASRHATSDWMAMERERGISITTSVMQFHYADMVINLLDTPGHDDFSEDTYRVLTAVDAALLVIDSAKGVEAQTKKLMEVCRLQRTPVITFINKLDRDGLAPLDLLADVEAHLGVETAPLSWPIGMGKLFRGTYSIAEKRLHLYSPTHGGRIQQGEVFEDIHDPRLDAILGPQADELRDDLELLAGAGNPFDPDRYLAGQQTPVFFGSALNNFGVQELLDTFVRIAPPPQPRRTLTREVVPTEEAFSGFVFKIQANMDPAHRDRIAFVRICSGKFTRGMKLRHLRLGKDIAVNNALIFLAQDRSGVDAAYPGDIIGLHNHGTIKIGDTFTQGEELKFVGIPSFAPEHFRKVVLQSPLKAKQLHKGLLQLAEEGAVQVFRPLSSNDYILGAVGLLQFEVITARLADEYGVDATYQPTSWNVARWVHSDDAAELARFRREMQHSLAMDAEDNLAILVDSAWRLDYIAEKWPGIVFAATQEKR